MQYKLHTIFLELQKIENVSRTIPRIYKTHTTFNR